MCRMDITTRFYILEIIIVALDMVQGIKNSVLGLKNYFIGSQNATHYL
jgi:hypothetical protein